MSRDHPPREWADPEECPVEGCSTTRYTSLGMGYHLLREHTLLRRAVVR
jgi:hypothetical protein